MSEIIRRSPLPKIPENWDPTVQTGLKVKTYSYFEYDEVSSALNKAIRRGQDYESLQFSIEGFLTNSHCKTNIWNRCLTIALEDVGIANVDAISIIYNLSKIGNILALATSAVYISRSKKSRLDDWALHIKFSEEYSSESPEILKSKLSENLKNRDLYRSIYYINSLFYTTQKVTGKYKNAQIKIWEVFLEMYPKNKYIQMLYELSMSQNWRWSGKGRLIHAHILHLIYYQKVPDNVVVIEPEVKLTELVEGFKNRTNPLLGIPDYALDKHTAKGRSLGRDIKHFLEDGALLINEAEEYKEQSLKYLQMCRF